MKFSNLSIMENYGYSDDEYNDRDYYNDYGDGDSLDGYQESPETEFQSPSGKGPSCKVITKQSLLAAQREELQRAMDLLSMKEHHARTLLIHYRWNIDKVFTLFIDKGRDHLYKEAGVTMGEHTDLSSSQWSSAVKCDICFEEILANDTTMMDCSHCFCNDCWAEYFVVKINEGQGRRIQCMAHNCNAICDEGKIRDLVRARDPGLMEKFDRFLLESYIEDNNRVKWCPSVPHCGNAIRVEDDEYCEVECACGLQFCFRCSAEPHSPCSCLMWEFWTKKCKDELVTVDWVTVHTKPCPKCQKPVDKDGGCNLVSCICGQAFCWLCGEATGFRHTLDSIEGHTCGRFKEEDVKKYERARKDLVRYVHYHDRYKAHTDSFKAEVNMKEKIRANISNLETREWKSKDFSWVTNGLYRLLRSRQILSYSYPFAYYMFGVDMFMDEMTEKEKEIKQNLFEDQQQLLEENVEKLSMLLHEPFGDYSDDKVLETRLKIITLSTLIDDLCKKLYERIEDDLLGPLQHATHIIAPYTSEGVEKASEIPQKDSAINSMYTEFTRKGV
ncbi:unnamed protein product [Ilex paraguariensis]|uniref:RBR-type E3 ubiquitin transferase n=1 Tax=Ilex paraguariensis TaxID=185542 RepID=A0ABC8UDJ5_9AQUA